MKQLLKRITSCKSTEEVFREVNSYLNQHNLADKYSKSLQRNLKASKSLNYSIQLVYNYYLNSSMPTKEHDTVTRKSWYHGTAIAGMECHSKA